jgi:PKD repeat protein
VRHTYTRGGTFTATVTATDPDGASDSAEVRITVGDPPGNQAPTVQAAADPGSGTAPLRVTFTSVAHDPDGDPLMTVWDFGDGAQAGGSRAVHRYTQPGTYTAKVTVTDSHGASATDEVQVTVRARGAAAASG